MNKALLLFFLSFFWYHFAKAQTLSLAPRVDYAAGSSPRGIATGDVNGDGKADLVTANFNSNNLSVLLGNGDGTFNPQRTFPTGSYPHSIAIGDLNGDGKADLVTANLYSDNVSVLLGNGDGTFNPQRTFLTGSRPYSIAIGDLNGDGKPDLVTANSNASNLSVLLGNGDGTFNSQRTFPTGSGPSSIAIGDLNGDGKPDLVTANSSASNLSVLLGNGDGTFINSGPTFPTGSYPTSIAIGDLNGDDEPDLVTANFNSNDVSVLLGNGDGTFINSGPTFPVGAGSASVAIGDLNEDDQPDLVAANYTSQYLSVLLGNGDGTFNPQQTFPTGLGLTSIAIGDLNGDDKPDLAAPNDRRSNISVLLNQTTIPIRYVKQGGTGNGSSWANASGDIQAMLDATDVEEVWVAAGSYKPNRKANATGTITPNDRDNAFVLKANVKLYGGFAGTETALSQRNWTTNRTILSADFNGDDVYDASGMLTANGGENAYHVVISAGAVGTACLDGFTIQGGNANGSNYLLVNATNINRDWGGGMHIQNSSAPYLANCVFSGNNGTFVGGALVSAYSSSPTIDGCTFTGNRGPWGGGITAIYTGSCTVTNSRFVNNTAFDRLGGAIYLQDNPAPNSNKIINCVFEGNQSQGSGGGIGSINSFATIMNCVFKSNTAVGYGGGCNMQNTPTTIMNCIFESNSAGIAGGGYTSSNSASTIINSTFTKNHGTSEAGAVRILRANANISNSICYGNTQGFAPYGQVYADGTGAGMNLSHNIIEGGITAGAFTYANGNAAIDARNVDPQFVSSTDYRLQCNSPALNAGDNAAYGASLSTDVDFAGQPRLATTTIDLGAYEMQMQSQNMTFGALTNRTYGDVEFDPGATLGSGLGVNYASSNTAVATIVAGKVQIHTAGTTTITASGTCDANYAATTDVQQTLVIDPKPVTVTAVAKSKVYGDADPALTYAVSPALVSGDAFTGELNRATGEDVGNYAINQNTLALNNNYVVTYAGDNLTIGKKPITVTADAKSKTYGDADPALTYQITSGALVGSDVISGSLDRATGEHIGNYAINKGTLAINDNYDITYTSNSLTIGKKTIAVTAIAKAKTYGDADPAFTYNAAPALISGDVFTGGLNRTAGENVGTYAINQGTLTLNGNYNITYTGNNFSISKKPITVTANARVKVYGETDPALTYSVAPALVSGDALTGTLSRVSGENAGAYAINQGSLTHPNYAVSFVNGQFTIAKANQQINWNQALTAGCDGNTYYVLTATASSGLPVSYQSGNTSVATINTNQLTIAGPGTATITASQAGNNNYNPATNVQNELLSKLPAHLIVKHWDDVLFFDNSSKQYTAWQWYKNDVVATGATAQYYHEAGMLNGAYHAVVKTTAGATLQTCPLTVTAGSSPILLSASPNPVGAGQAITIKTGYTAAALQGATIMISNVQGMVMRTLQNISPQTNINMPFTQGIYIIRLRLATGVTHSTNVLVGER